MKRCPVCLSNAPLEATRCPVCAEPLPAIDTGELDERPEDTLERTLPAQTSDAVAHLQAFERLLDESDLDRSVEVDLDLTSPLYDEAVRGAQHTGDLPAVSVVEDPLTPIITVFEKRRPRLKATLATTPFTIGRRDPASGHYPNLDLTPLEGSTVVSRRHAQIVREGDLFFLEPISSAGTQIGHRLLHPGDRAPLIDGDLIVLSGAFVLKFALDDVG